MLTIVDSDTASGAASHGSMIPPAIKPWHETPIVLHKAWPPMTALGCEKGACVERERESTPQWCEQQHSGVRTAQWCEQRHESAHEFDSVHLL